MQQKLKYFFHRLKTHPNSRLRKTAGILLVIGGLLGALPILGFWMIPLGIAVLAVDFPWARRLYLRFVVIWRRLRQFIQIRRSKKQQNGHNQNSNIHNSNRSDTTPKPSSDDH